MPSHVSRRAEALLETARWQSLSWRVGTRGPLRAKFAAVRVCVADGPRAANRQRLPGALVWLVGEWRPSGERKYYLTNHPAGTSLRTLAATIKARWVCEQGHQQLKEELGLDHFEGRSWLGLHHHALFTMLAFTFFQHLRLRLQAGKENSSRRATTPADLPGGAPHAPYRHDPIHTSAMSGLSRAHHPSPNAVEYVAK